MLQNAQHEEIHKCSYDHASVYKDYKLFTPTRRNYINGKRLKHAFIGNPSGKELVDISKQARTPFVTPLEKGTLT